ncbi:MAG: hypothetical protein ACPLRX_05025 [Candidatus Saccharicenans sp.]
MNLYEGLNRLIEFIFTVDYEVYGNGQGSLKSEVYEPAEALTEVFSKNYADLVFFIEVAELEKMEESGSDPSFPLVLNQIRKMAESGYEVGLHVHPQWYGAQLVNRQWVLNYSEYNLCLLSEERITELVNRGLNYLRYLVGDNKFTPVAYRAGNWLMQPAERIAQVLSRVGVKIDSSVFKGGFQHKLGLDYRKSPKHLYFWKFSRDVNRPEPEGLMTEFPVFSRQVPPWKLLNPKRRKLENMDRISGLKDKLRTRLKDFLRLKVPQKFDFCRLDLNELCSFTEDIIKEDRKSPQDYKPIVLIGHTKDQPEPELLDTFLKFLADRGIKTTTFSRAWELIQREPEK